MSMYSHIFYRDTFFDRHTLTPMTYTPKHAKVLYVCELEKLIKLTIDIPASLHSHIQEDAERIIESLYAHAHQCNIINPSHTYSLYFSCKSHFHETSLQECEAYFIDHHIFTNLPKHTKVCEIAIDAYFLAQHIKQGFVYIKESHILYYIDNAQILSTLYLANDEELTQKTQLFSNMFGKHTLQVLDSFPTQIFLESSAKDSQDKSSPFCAIFQNCKREYYTYTRALLHNKLGFIRNNFGLFGKAQTHIIRNLIITLAIMFGLVYPSALFAHTYNLTTHINTLQSQEYDFTSLEHSTTAQTNELNKLLAHNNQMYQQISFVLGSLNTKPLSVRMEETFALLAKHSAHTTNISFAKNTGRSVALMDIIAPTQAHITQLLKALNTDTSQAKISHITHKDNKAHSQILVVYHE